MDTPQQNTDSTKQYWEFEDVKKEKERIYAEIAANEVEINELLNLINIKMVLINKKYPFYTQTIEHKFLNGSLGDEYNYGEVGNNYEYQLLPLTHVGLEGEYLKAYHNQQH